MAGAEHASLELCIKGLPPGVDGDYLIMARTPCSYA